MLLVTEFGNNFMTCFQKTNPDKLRNEKEGESFL